MGLLTTLISCEDRGKVTQQPIDFIEIHGKIYKLMNVIPCDGCSGIWIMYPKDSADKQPQVINYSQKQGKATVNQTIIQVD